MAYKEDTDRVIDVLREIGDEMRQEPQYAALIVEPLEVLGVDRFTDSGVMIRARIKATVRANRRLRIMSPPQRE